MSHTRQVNEMQENEKLISKRRMSAFTGTFFLPGAKRRGRPSKFVVARADVQQSPSVAVTCATSLPIKPHPTLATPSENLNKFMTVEEYSLSNFSLSRRR